MEQVLKLIYNVLSNDSNVTGITSRLYPVVAPENTAFPCVVYWVSGVSPSDTKSGVSTVDNMFVTIDSYAANTSTSSGYTVVSNLAGHIRSALDRLQAGTYSTITVDGAQFIDAEIGYDADSDVYVVSMDFKFRVNR